MRIACGRALFELNSNLLNSLSMRILIRIRVDRPQCYNVKLIPMLVLIYIRTYVVLMLVFKQHDVNYITVISLLGCKYVRLIHI